MSLPFSQLQPLNQRRLALLLAICLPLAGQPADGSPQAEPSRPNQHAEPVVAKIKPLGPLSLIVPVTHAADLTADTVPPTTSIRIGRSSASTLKLLPLETSDQQVVDPEQNEPASSEATAEPTETTDALADDVLAWDELTLEELPEGDPDPEPAEMDHSVADEQPASEQPTSERAREIRRLRDADLGPDLDDDVWNRRDVSPLDASAGTRMHVGDDLADRDPSPIDETQLQPLDESPSAIALIPEQGSEFADDNPIQGDRISDQGELILASGPTAAAQQIQPGTARLKPLIERTLRYYWQRPEDAAIRTHWGMMHSIMIYDRDTQIISNRQRLNAVAWMAGNNPCRNQTLFSVDQHGIVPKTGVGVQGHQAQLLAIFGLVNVPLNYPIYADNQKYTVDELLAREKRDCQSGSELTFTLIALAHYADSDSQWKALDGEAWSVERVIREELGQPIVGAACGGTHRLMGFGHALRRRRAENKPIDGQWQRADTYINDFVAYTWSLQNRDGSMSTAWYEKREDNGNMDRKIQTTGHMLEMLLTVTPDAELQSPQMIRAVNYLASTMHNERGHEWQVGPKGHALRALAMYYQRVFGSSTPWRETIEARSAQQPPTRATQPRSTQARQPARAVR